MSKDGVREADRKATYDIADGFKIGDHHDAPEPDIAFVIAAYMQPERAMTQRLAKAMESLKRGSCFCELAVGNPMVSRHTSACIEATQAIAAYHAATGQDDKEGVK